MFTPFVISLKEGMEIFLILVPFILYFKKTKSRIMLRSIIWGMCLGIMSATLAGILLFEQIKNLEGLGKTIFNGGIFIFLSMLVLYNIIEIVKYKKNLVKLKVTVDSVAVSKANLFLLSCFTVFRELSEVLLFIMPTFTNNIILTVTGCISGILCALSINLVIFKFTMKFNINILFFIITLVLIIIGSEMFGEGISYFIPGEGKTIETACRYIYMVPLLYVYIKKELKNIMKNYRN
jgi:high-affinity iron transporter